MKGPIRKYKKAVPKRAMSSSSINETINGCPCRLKVKNLGYKEGDERSKCADVTMRS
jgi:hypothetical protein